LDFGLQPKEQELLDLLENSDSQLIGYGGARGGAKSHAIRACAVMRRIKYPGTNGVIFRRTYPNLWETHIQRLMIEWPELYQKYWSADNKALMLPGNSTLLFRYADTLADIMEFRGREYGDLFIDEATDQTEQELKILYSCCRSTVPGFRPKKVLAFNPGGVGHAYVKRVFIDKQPTPAEAAQHPRFIQSYAWDNIEWAREALESDKIEETDYKTWAEARKIKYLIERTDYGRELDALPPELRDAWLYGSWNVFSGQFFDIFDVAKHVESMQEAA
jgi:phage terminase large subunit